MPGGRFSGLWRPGEPIQDSGRARHASTHCFERHSSTITPRHLLSSSAENSALR
jgi:hypothetical protein